MSEYQFVHFLAIDRPLNDEQLGYMARQSSRAEITPWEFSNEYHYGGFRGNPSDMLQRGYDVHLHYANFGIRRLMIRLPMGLPCDVATCDAFFVDDMVMWSPDHEGPGGILDIQPEADAGTFNEDLWDAGRLLPQIAPMREMLIAGDLRPLYLMWLACAYGDETLEPPVPAGLGELPSTLAAMANFYEISDPLLSAAALRSPPLPKTNDQTVSLQRWIGKRSAAELRDLVQRLLGAGAGEARAETLARVRDETGATTWPLAEPARTLAQLHESAKQISQQRLAANERARAAARKKHLKGIAADPDKLIADARKRVAQRSVRSYEQAASDLADLREALGPEEGAARAEAVAEELRRANPTLRCLVSALRKKGLLRK